MVAAPPDAGHEFSIESTPDSLDDEKADDLEGHGVTRVSVGVQSFRPGVARRARPPPHRRADSARGRGGAATRTGSVARSDLRRTGFHPRQVGRGPRRGPRLRAGPHLDLRPDLREGHAAVEARRAGGCPPRAEDDELAMYELAIDRSTAAGFEHYEVSNFARPGFRCRHNERYWANEAYYGFGVGAARYVGGVRELNTRDTKALHPQDARRRIADVPERATRAARPGLRDDRHAAPPRGRDRPDAVPRTDRLRPGSNWSAPRGLATCSSTRTACSLDDWPPR